MTINEILAWLSVIFTVLLALKYVTRIIRHRPLNNLFRKFHKQLGVLMIITGLLHGILASNEETTPLFGMQFVPKLFSLDLGTACLFVALLLLLTYLFRRKIKKYWMFLHQALTVILLILLVLHIHEEIDRQHYNQVLHLTKITKQSLG